jgi:hypothetical protein
VTGVVSKQQSGQKGDQKCCNNARKSTNKWIYRKNNVKKQFVKFKEQQQCRVLAKAFWAVGGLSELAGGQISLSLSLSFSPA